MRMSLSWLVGPIVIVMAGCASTGPTLSSSAERLEESSFAMERYAGQSSVRQDARELSEEAREFRRLLLSKRADRRDVSEGFEDVSRSYHSLRDEVERSRDRETERYFPGLVDVADGSGMFITNLVYRYGADRLYVITGEGENDWVRIDSAFNEGGVIECEASSGCWMLASGVLYRPLGT